MPDPGNLYIRWSETGSDDNRTDPGGAVAYKSKSLQIINPNDPNQDDGRALTGVDQQIRVKIDSLQVATPNVVVQVWACAWGTAGQPYLPSANGAQGLSRDLDDQLNPFTANPAPPAQQLTVDFDWRPRNSDLTSIGEPLTAPLHVCLYANCYSTAGQGDGAQVPPPGPPVINVASNRHHGQRNIRVFPVVNAMDRARIRMFSGNPFAEGEAVFVLQAAELERPRLDKDALKRLQLGRWLRDDEKLPGHGAKLQLAQETVPELGLAIGGEKSRKGPVEVSLTAGEPQPVELDVAVPEAKPGTLHVLDVVHRHEKGVVGGASVLLLTVDEERYAAFQPEPAAAV